LLVTHEAHKYFFVGLDEDTFFPSLDTVIDPAPSNISSLATAFKRNLQSVNVTVAVPFRIVFVAVTNERLSRLHLAAEMRSRARALRSEETDPDKDRRVRQEAADNFRQELATPETIERLVNQTLDNLLSTVKDEDFARAARELLRQGVVLLWGALEVLANDLFVCVLNKRPALALALTEKEETKRMFQLRGIPFDTLSLYGYDLSGRMGDIFAQQKSIDSVPSIKAVFEVVAPSDPLRTILARPTLWLLNQRRHLIVHRRAVVDQTYLENTGEKLQLGSELEVSPYDLDGSLELVRDVGVELVRACSDAINEQNP